MFFAYKMVAGVKNSSVRRILYHVIQLLVGLGLGFVCDYFTQAIINGVVVSKQLFVVSASMAVGWFILSFGWYTKEEKLYQESKNKK